MKKTICFLIIITTFTRCLVAGSPHYFNFKKIQSETSFENIDVKIHYNLFAKHYERNFTDMTYLIKIINKTKSDMFYNDYNFYLNSKKIKYNIEYSSILEKDSIKIIEGKIIESIRRQNKAIKILPKDSVLIGVVFSSKLKIKEADFKKLIEFDTIEVRIKLEDISFKNNLIYARK